MNRWLWPTLVAVGLAALAAGLTGGLPRGAAYGRYVAAQAVVEGRLSTIDGHIDGVRPRPELTDAGELVTLTNLAYVGGHYFLNEPPLLTWAAAPLYAAGALAASAAPGALWGPAVVGVLGPLLLLAALLGVMRLLRQIGAPPSTAAAIVVLCAATTPLLPAAVVDSASLAGAALLVWLMVGTAWEGRAEASAHGALAGLLIGAYPWLAPAALVAVAAGWKHWRWRVLGMVPPLVLVGVWQFLLFGRPWRVASQFALGEPVPRPMSWEALVAVGVTLFATAVVRNRRFWWLAAVSLLATVGAFAMSDVAMAHPDVWLVGTIALGLAMFEALLSAQPGALRLVLYGLLGAWSIPVALIRLASTMGEARLGEFTWEQRTCLVALVLTAAAGGLVWSRVRRPVLATVGGTVLLGWLLGSGSATAATQSASSLLPPFSAPATAGGPPLRLWRLFGAADIRGDRLLLPDALSRAVSPAVAARMGEQYCAYGRPAAPTLVFVWEDDGHRVLAEHGGPDAGRPLCFAAPPGTTAVRLRAEGGPRAVELDGVAFWSAGPRVAPLPDYARAALAFTFDWESTMGGLIHSKGGAAGFEAEGEGPARQDGGDGLTIAVQRGERMRRGAEALAELFRAHDIRATFYATGYNLLTGNAERRTFAGDPTYRWASRRNGWANDYWTTRPWYGDDPYGTEATYPAWYFGALTRRLAGAGHEIESHTFGHLYVRGTSPDELAADLAEWNAAAARLGLPPARSFAFPWRSSNSVREPHFSRLTAAGIGSVTRVYRLREGAEYELDEVEGMPGLMIYPDLLVRSTPDGSLAARRAIDEVLLRAGYQSLWTHPEEVVDPGQVAVWREVVAYAAEARPRGLWVAPLGEIVERVRAGRQVEVIAVRDGRAQHVRVTNLGQRSLDGVVIELARPVDAWSAGGRWPDQRDSRLRLASLAPSEVAALTVFNAPRAATD